MREIKFRGKRVDTGEWVIGYYTRNCDAVIIVDEMEEEDFLVSAETVGQYTGLKDKNGKEIYEGDVVVIAYEQWRKYTVEYWDAGWGAFALVADGKYFESDLADYSDLEVIGNTHDKEPQ